MRYVFAVTFGLISLSSVVFGLLVITPVGVFTVALTLFYLAIAVMCGGLSLAFFTGDLR